VSYGDSWTGPPPSSRFPENVDVGEDDSVYESASLNFFFSPPKLRFALFALPPLPPPLYSPSLLPHATSPPPLPFFPHPGRQYSPVAPPFFTLFYDKSISFSSYSVFVFSLPPSFFYFSLSFPFPWLIRNRPGLSGMGFQILQCLLVHFELMQRLPSPGSRLYVRPSFFFLCSPSLSLRPPPFRLTATPFGFYSCSLSPVPSVVAPGVCLFSPQTLPFLRFSPPQIIVAGIPTSISAFPISCRDAASSSHRYRQQLSSSPAILCSLPFLSPAPSSSPSPSEPPSFLGSSSRTSEVSVIQEGRLDFFFLPMFCFSSFF